MLGTAACNREDRAFGDVTTSCVQPAPFKRPDRLPYLEPQHIKRLADDGLDHPRFVGAVCPNCHREIHYGATGSQKNRQL